MNQFVVVVEVGSDRDRLLFFSTSLLLLLVAVVRGVSLAIFFVAITSKSRGEGGGGMVYLNQGVNKFVFLRCLFFSSCLCCMHEGGSRVGRTHTFFW